MSSAPFVPLPAAYVAGWPAAVLARYLAEPDGLESWLDAQGIPDTSRASVRATYDAIRAAAAAWHDQGAGSAGGTRGRRPAPGRRPLPAMTTTDAAAHLGCSPRAVRKAAAAGRLPATKVAGAWRVDLPDPREDTP